jgi:WD40 repeat protein
LINAIVHTGKELWSCGDNAIKIWDNEGREKAALDAHTGKVLCLKKVRRYVLSGSFDKSILVWDAQVTTSSLPLLFLPTNSLFFYLFF